jgi:glucose-6-phosphate isomerase
MSGRTSTSEAPGGLETAYRAALDSLVRDDAVARLFRRDPTLWSEDPEHQKIALNRLGWLESPRWLGEKIEELNSFASEIREDGFTRVLLLGMGGSSLAAEVFAEVLTAAPGAPTLEVLDSTDPASLRAAEASHRLDRTFFLVSSKSGRTIETLSQYRYFRTRLEEMRIADAPRRFTAITDEGSALERLAREEGMRRVFLNPADIGGRYSALSYFGMIPAALLGLDLESLAERASRAAEACASSDPARNDALRLGAFLAAAALAGKDKLTLLTSASLRPLGYWIEQLVAESTGKEGRGIVPVEGEPPGFARYYSADRFFVSIALASEPVSDLAGLGTELRQAGAPWIEITLSERAELAAEFFRWETATAIAGVALRIDPFDEPNVQESKDNTAAILVEIEKTGDVPSGEARSREEGVEVYVTDRLWRTLTSNTPGHPSLEMLIGRFLALKKPGDYLAILAYLQRTAASESAFAQLRREIRDAVRIPVLQGYGPRYLHSIGQLYKGGPPSGIFLVITAANGQDLPIPESQVTFGRLELAQALGDLRSLDSRGKPALRLHIAGSVTQGLATIAQAVERALVAIAPA